jgi:hypothetical protein
MLRLVVVVFYYNLKTLEEFHHFGRDGTRSDGRAVASTNEAFQSTDT